MLRNDVSVNPTRRGCSQRGLSELLWLWSQSTQQHKGRQPTFSSSLRGSPSSSWEKSRNATEPSIEHTKMPSPFRVLKDMAISSLVARAPGRHICHSSWPVRMVGSVLGRCWKLLVPFCGLRVGGRGATIVSQRALVFFSSKQVYKVSLTICSVRIFNFTYLTFETIKIKKKT